MRLAVITAILASAALIAAPAAFADGDPASDVLVESVVFNPIDGVSLASQARLEAVAERECARWLSDPRCADRQREGSRHGDAAVGQARQLRAYLDTELSLSYRGQVLVVMPSGFGLHGPARGPHAVSAAEVAVKAPAPGPGEQLAMSALSAVPLLAAAAGHPIPPSALAAAERSATAGQKSVVGSSLSPGVVVALLVGALLIALAGGRACARARCNCGAGSSRKETRARAVTASIGHTHHTTPAGWFVAVVVLLVVLYVLWRSGRLRKLVDAIGERRMSGAGRGALPEGVHVRPVALVPLALLLIVIVVLLIAH